ncbi:MAG TPA: DUF4340 domain-containing protein [Bryobacteraceae bacterium]|jgi:hypothetical protein|nr:DUF4340 domain-containing protein [Bryobacteraceae bacterium]
MKIGGLVSAVGVLAVLGGLVWWTNKHPSTGADAKKADATPKIISLDPGQMQQIRIAKPGSDPVMLKKLADVWTITEPKPMDADSEAVGPLTGALGTITADRVIDENPSTLEPYGLGPTAMEVDITTKDGKTTKLLVGSATPSGSDNYAKVEGNPKVYTIASSVKTGFDKGVDDLRDKRLMTFNQNKLTAVTLAAKGATGEFTKTKDGDWQITKPKPMRADSLQVDDLVRKMIDAKMDLSGNYDPKEAAEKFATGTKIATVSATDNHGTQTMEVRKAKDDYYAKSSAVEGVYKIVSDIGEGLNKSVDDFRNKKVFDFGFNDVTKLELNGTSYDKAGDKWTSSGVQFDSGTVQNAIDKLRDLTATKFSEKMGGTKVLSVAVTSGDSHRLEKVTINKDGDAYDAQRDGDPTVYVLDAKAVDELQKAVSGIKQYVPPKNDGKK